jgi:hypothetical protein
MEKISDLIRLKDKLILLREELNNHIGIPSTIHFIKSQENELKIHDEGLIFLEQLIAKYNVLLNRENNIIKFIDDKTIAIQDRIDHESIKKFDSLEYHEHLNENYLGVINDIDEKIKEIIDNRISTYAQPNYNSLLINPLNKDIILPMVSSDLLYICKIHYNNHESSDEYLKTLINHFPEIYQKRLRLYKITPYDFTPLPQHQMAFILCWNILEFRSMDRIKTYIRKAYDLLRPGGTFMFSFNNCELASSMNSAETKNKSPSTFKELLEYSEITGYKLTRVENYKINPDVDEYISWLEITKPGDLKTVKIRQVLGRVIPN